MDWEIFYGVVKALKGINILSGGKATVALILSNLCASTSTLLARSVNASTSYLPLLLFGAVLSLDQS